MKKTNIIKVVYILFIVTILALIFSNYVYGVSLPSNLSNIYKASDKTISNIGAQVIWIVQAGLYAAAVIAFMIAICSRRNYTNSSKTFKKYIKRVKRKKLTFSFHFYRIDA